jgi:hypothetical protein
MRRKNAPVDLHPAGAVGKHPITSWEEPVTEHFPKITLSHTAVVQHRFIAVIKINMFLFWNLLTVLC